MRILITMTEKDKRKERETEKQREAEKVSPTKAILHRIERSKHQLTEIDSYMKPNTPVKYDLSIYLSIYLCKAKEESSVRLKPSAAIPHQTESGIKRS